MTVVANRGGPVRRVCPGQDEVPEDQQKAFLLKIPTLHDKARFQRAVMAQGARYVADSELHAIMREAITQLFEPGDPDRRRYDELLDQAISGGLDDDQREQLSEAEGVIMEYVPAYRKALADRQFYLSIAEIEALRMFLAGWENFSVPFRRTDLGVPVDLIEALDPVERLFASGEIFGLMAPNRDEVKNSESPPSTSQDATVSPAANMPQAKPRSADTTKPGNGSAIAGTSQN